MVLTPPPLNIAHSVLIGWYGYKQKSVVYGLVIGASSKQGFGSGSARTRINLSCWIRIQIQEGKMTHKNR